VKEGDPVGTPVEGRGVKEGDPVGTPVKSDTPIKLPLEWEVIQNYNFWGTQSKIARARVPGGWLLVRGVQGGMCFVPDPTWRWVVDDDEA
jgi:hypothetical protein